ncbi:MAG: methylaspartate mutase subunit E [Defluviitaleaceae bacterium]|nr:methylaspartate mutase subunit E [Defluviitaleaceae bacterium]MCL2273591.1 methylaspartate mutase subunit E [Defluviitaleaceae bacterium]
MEITNKRLSEQNFAEIQKEVLAQWPTGAEVNFENAVAFHKQYPASKSFAQKLAKADKEGITLIQPRAGVALPDLLVELLSYLETEGEADLLPTTIDSYTRHNRYNEADTGIEESKRENRSMLNGFPAVNYGVEICRKINTSLKAPLQVRHGTPDARLLTEITMAGGFTSYEGGGISYNIPYSKNYSLEKSLADWQYADRLLGLYAEAGVIINKEPFGPLTGTLVPPCVSHAVAVIETLLAAEQGVQDITVGYGQCGNLVQDVAAIKSLRAITEEYLQKYGYNNVKITTVLHQWMGGFPQDESKAFGVISWGAAAAALAKATKVIVKTPHEAMGIPTKEANASGLKATKQVVSMLKDQSMLADPLVIAEYEIIMEETRALLEKTYELGGGDFAVGTVRAFQAGVLDIPFAPSRNNMGKLLPARDNTGAVRLLDCGNLPFTEEMKNFHRQRLEERGAFEKRAVSFQMVVDDIYAIGKGHLVGRK